MTGVLDETVIQRIREYRLWLDELKAAQRVGAASLLVVNNKSAAAVDQGVTIAAAGQTSFPVTFTAATQDHALAALDLVFYSNSAGTTLALPPVRVEERVVPAGSPKVTTWQVTVQNPDDLNAATYYIKRVVNATDSGAIS